MKTLPVSALERDLQLDLADLLILEFAALNSCKDMGVFLDRLVKYTQPHLPQLKLAEAARRLESLQQRGLVGRDLRTSEQINYDVAAIAELNGRAEGSTARPDNPLWLLENPYLQDYQLEQVLRRVRYPETFLVMEQNAIDRILGAFLPARLRTLQPLGVLAPFLELIAKKLTSRGKIIQRELQLGQHGPGAVSGGRDSVRACICALTGDFSKADQLLADDPCYGSVFSEMVAALLKIRGGKSFQTGDLLYSSQSLKRWIAWFGATRSKGKNSAQPAWQDLKGTLDLLFVGGVAHWEEDYSLREELQPELRAAAQTAAASGWGYVAELFEQLAEDRPGPWRDFLPCSPGWKRRLEGLLQLQAPAEDLNERVVWKLNRVGNDWEAEPYLQKRNKRGWTSGRNFFLGSRPHNLGRQDRQSLDSFLSRDPEKAWRSLVGHPLLFFEDQKVSLESGEARLRVSRQQGRIGLRLEPAGLERGFCLRQLAPDRLELVILPMNLVSLAEALGQSGLSIPEDQEEQLAPLLGRLSGSVSIASDVELDNGLVEERELHRVLYLRLSPQGLGLQMQALIRPFGPDSSAYIANQGPLRLVVRLQGRATQVTRDPQWELSILHWLGLEGQGPWVLPDPLSCLELLDKVSAYSGQDLQLEWPEGQSFRLKRASGKFDMRVESKTDWLEVSGGMELDAGQELKIQQMLEMLRQGHGRFLALSSGEFLALSEEMAARLRTLAEVAESSKGSKLRLHPLTAGWLGDFPDLQADRAFQALLSKIQKVQDLKTPLPKTFRGELRGYQLEGFGWLCQRAEWGVGACLADDMGLGKTIQTLAMLLQRANGGPSLVVAPTSVTYNWLEESTRFAPTLRLIDFRLSRSLDSVGPGDVVICSYGLLVNEIERFESVDWNVVVLDEAQAIKNSTSQRNQAACRLPARARLATTGTPVENRLDELWALFRFLNPGLLGSQERFRQRFVLPIEAGQARSKAVLRQLVHPFLLRRTKNEVLRELPPRTEITLEVPQSPEERAFYEALRRQAVEQLQKGKVDPMHVLTELTRLRRACCHPGLVSKTYQGQGSKQQTLLALLQELKEGGHRALVFSQFVDHLSLLRPALEAAGFTYNYLDGGTSVTARKQQVKDFQAGQTDLFLISLKAGGVGLNLTAADYVIHMDPWWNPAVEDQASDRAHRIGQQRPVTVYRLVAQNTVEDKIVALHLHKRELAQSLLEGSDKPTRLDAQEMLRLIRDDT